MKIRPKIPPERFSNEEDKVIVGRFPTSGAPGCAQLLRGRTEEEIDARAAEIGVVRRPNFSHSYKAKKPGNDVVPVYVERECLRCHEKFLAPGRFIRVCHQCKQTGAWRDAGPGVSSAV